MCFSKLTASVLMILFLAAVSEGDNGTEWRFYPFGQDEGDQRLDGVSSSAIMLRTPFVFYNQNQSTIFVDSNGVLSLQKAFQLPESFQEFPIEGTPLIAPFWHHGTLQRGQVFYRQTNAPDIIQYVQEKVRTFFPEQKGFIPTDIFIATWHRQDSEETDIIQVALITNGVLSFVDLLYLNPETWKLSDSIQMGLNSGLESDSFPLSYFTLPNMPSGVDNVWGNTGAPGEWFFRVDTAVALQPQQVPLLISFEMEQYSVTEGDGLVEVCVQFVTLSDDTKDMPWESFPVTIATVAVESSAVAEEDYLETSTNLTNGNLSSPDDKEQASHKCIAIRIVDDFVHEDKESFNISLTTTSRVVTLYSSATVVVFDDDDEEGSQNVGKSSEIRTIQKRQAVNTPVSGDLRLSRGFTTSSSFTSGRLEVFVFGRWGTVCSDFWDSANSDVACRQLGFSGAARPTSFATSNSAGFGSGSGPIWLDDVNCVGTETCLLNCPNRGVGSSNCGHFQDVAIFCASSMNDSESGSGNVSESTAYLLYSTSSAINRVELDGSQRTTVTSSGTRGVRALDFDIRRNFVFWSNTFFPDTIRRAQLDGFNLTTLIDSGLSFPTGLAWDWINEKLYWADPWTREIAVFDPSTGDRRVLFDVDSSSTSFGPRALVIDPVNARMFWSDTTLRRIERASMDGTARMVLHDTNISVTVGMTLDYDTQTLYWIDSWLRTLESSGVDGSNRVLLTELPRFSRPWDVTFFEGTLYWTDQRLNAIYSSSVDSPGNFSIVTQFFTDPFGIKVISERRQMEAMNPCATDNGNCSHLCLLSSEAPTGFTCACPDRFSLDTNQQDCFSITDRLFYPFGANESDVFLSPFDDTFALLSLSEPFPFYGNSSSLLYVSSNGLISFDIPFTRGFPLRFPTDFTPPLIAPFWADAQGENISFRETNDTEVLSRAQDEVQTYFNISGFIPTYAVVVTWFEVVRFRGSSQQNTFQAVLVTDGQRSFIIYLYAFIEWGNFITNLGYNAGDGLRHVMFPEAFTSAVQSIEETSNVGVRGVYAFRVDGLLIEDRNGVANEIMATVSLERTFFRVDETDNSVEVCVLFRGLGVGENTITIIIFTQDGSAVGSAANNSDSGNNFNGTDYISIMEPLVFDGSATSDRQCVNITILDDDIPEGRFSEFFTVRIRVAEENENETLLRNSWATIQINNDDPPRTCVEARFFGCCFSFNCFLPAGNCSCDVRCYRRQDCCDDIRVTCQRDPCNFSPCGFRAQCFSGNTTESPFDCACRPGFTGDPFSRCNDINECEIDSNNSTGSGSGDFLGPCGLNQTCINTFGSFFCLCPSGFTNVDGVCVDINECAFGPGQCSQLCINTQGSFTCGCQEGFRLDTDGRGCINENLFPFGFSEGDRIVSRFSSASSRIELCTPFPFFGTPETALYVNANGVLSFRFTFTTSFIRTFPFFSAPLIAPYWENFDLRRGGNLYYRQTSNPTLIQRAREQLQRSFPTDGSFIPTDLFIATWDRVPGRFQRFGLENSLQVVMVTDGQSSFMFFLYSNIEWGFANIGFNAGDNMRSFMLPGARTFQIRNVENGSNVDIPGLYIYRVDQRLVFDPSGTAGTVIISLERTSYTVDEASGFVEVCVILEGLGVEEGDITVDLVTESSTATGSVGSSSSSNFGDADYVSLMESLVFDGSATSDRQCVNITILNDDERESPTFGPLAERFRVRLNVSNDAVQVETQTAFVSIEDDDFATMCSEVFSCCCFGFGSSCRLRQANCACDENCYRRRDCCEDIQTTCPRDPCDFSPCGFRAQCVSGNSTNGTFDCICNPGFTGNPPSFCFDINECLQFDSGSDELGPCGPNATCVNTFGSFFCRCRQGFTMVGGECVDINECVFGSSQCSQLCINTQGSFTCGCQEGFRLDTDGRGCINENLFPFGFSEGDLTVPRFRDGSSPRIDLCTPIPFFGTTEVALYVNTNGLLSFRSPFTSSFTRTFPFFGPPLIAPYWENFDLRRGGNLFYRQTSNVSLIQRVRNQLQNIFPSANDFPPTRLFIATWDRVPGRFQRFGLDNTLQVVIATDGQVSFVLYLYSNIEWGVANIGFNAGDNRRSFMAPGSLTSQTRNFESGSNVNIPGSYIYRVDQRLVFDGRTSAIISLERSSYTVSEASGFVEVCADLEGLGVEEGDITVDIFTESLSATGSNALVGSGNGSDVSNGVGSRSNESVVDNEGSGNSVEGGSGVGNESGRVSNNCNLAAIDLVFILDASGSVGRVDFQNILNFVSDIVRALEIGPNAGQVAVIRFASSASLIFGLTAHDNQVDLLRAISNVPYTGGGTDTAEALNLLLSRGFIGARPAEEGIPRVAVVITDGLSNNRLATTAAAAAVHAAEPEIIVFAAGIRNFNLNELQVIASSPSSRFVITIANFNSTEMRRLTEAVRLGACQAAARPEIGGQAIQRRIRQGVQAFFEYQVPRQGFTIRVTAEEGRLAVCGSRTLQRPSCSDSSLYDWRREVTTSTAVYITPEGLDADSLSNIGGQVSANITLFLSCEGLVANNSFILSTTFADTRILQADYISIMESLIFNGSATSDRQCVNITIVDDDLTESSIFTPQPEVFQVLLRVSEPNDAIQLGVQIASVSIEDDDFPTNCAEAGFSGCCFASCQLPQANCWCDVGCYRRRDCCNDIQTTCPRNPCDFATCGANAQCVSGNSTNETFDCVCNPGFTGDPFISCFDENFYPFGFSAGDFRLFRTNDGSSGRIFLFPRFRFFGTSQVFLYVNANGILSFRSRFTSPFRRSFPFFSVPLIAPYWDNVDTQRFGNIFYRQTTDTNLLQRARNQLQELFPSAGNFTPSYLFIATWDRVAQRFGGSQENTFQVVLATDGQLSFAFFMYGDIEWGAANIGFNAGDNRRSFMAPGALTSQSRNIQNGSNVNVPGLYIYRIDLATILRPNDVLVSLERTFFFVSESSGTQEVCVAAPDLSKSINVTLLPINGSAEGNGRDFIILNQDLTITATSNGSRGCFNITIIDDSTIEDTESFQVSLTSTSDDVAVANSLATIRITDNDELTVSLEEQVYEVGEVDTSRHLAVLICAQTGGAEIERFSSSFVTFSTGSGTARDGVDFVGTRETFRFSRFTNNVPQCACIPILQDSIAEGREFFAVGLRTFDSRVRLVQNSATVIIADDDVVGIGLENSTYYTSENAGSVMVCAQVTGPQLGRIFTVNLTTQDGTAQSISPGDYTSVSTQLMFDQNNRRQCVEIAIVNDTTVEDTEIFFIVLLSPEGDVQITTGNATVHITDNSGPPIRWINDSPRMNSNTISADLFIANNLESVTCRLYGQRSRTTRTADCSSGSVSFTVNNRLQPLILTVTGNRTGGEVAITLVRDLRIERIICYLHLINDGVTVTGDTVTVEWQGTGPTAANRITEFDCRLNNEGFQSCTSPYVRSGLAPGNYALQVQPSPDQNCRRRFRRTINFTV